MTTAIADLDLRIWRNLDPPKRLPLAAWADANYVLPSGDPNAGRWQSLPYQRGILDAISDPKIERITLMKSSRVGYTKMLLAATAYFIVEDPGPILIVQPTIDDAKNFSKEDVAPMLRDVPVLAGLVAEPRVKDSENTISQKVFRGGSLSLIGANSPRGFRRVSRRIVIFDEIDGYPPSAGTEGDPYKLGERRSVTFWNRKIIAGSTPGQAGASKVEDLFMDGDQRRFYVPCPTCATMQVLKMDNLKWPQGPASAHFVCIANGCRITESYKRAIVDAGEWRAEAPEHFAPPLHRHASFHIWTAYSYSPNAGWAQIADEFVKAQGNAHTMKTFRNTVQGDVWRQAVVAMEWERLARRREAYAIGSLPRGVCLLTAGVDVQKDRLVYEVVGWGRGLTTWSIDAGALIGDTSTAGPWGQLDALLARTYAFADDDTRALTISRLAVDCGYNTQHVYKWARQYPFSRVIPVKGQAGMSGMLLGTPRLVEYTGTGKKIKRGQRHWPVFVHVAKDELFGFLGLDLPTDGSGAPPGYCHFPEYDDAFFQQITAEHLVTSKTGRWHEYRIQEGRENHALDARVYARAAAAAERIDRFTDADWDALEAQHAPASAALPPIPTRIPDARPVSPIRRTDQPWLGGRRRDPWLRR